MHNSLNYQRVIGSLLLICLLLLYGCSSSKQFSSLLQTNSASLVVEDYEAIIDLLIEFKQALDLRNPRQYNVKLSNVIYINMKELNNTITLTFEQTALTDHTHYLKQAFSQYRTDHRNDWLILGLYKMVYEAYSLTIGHKVTALSYDIEKLKKLYYTLQVVSWKLKSARGYDGEYLFLTWQKNWQIELSKKIRMGNQPSWEMIQELEYIKNKKETLFDASNFSFEVRLSKMMYHVKNSLNRVGVEPVDMGIEALKRFALFL